MINALIYRLVTVIVVFQELMNGAHGFFAQPTQSLTGRIVTVMMQSFVNTFKYGRLIVINAPIDTILLIVGI